MELNYNGSGSVFYKNTAYRCDLYLNEDLGGILIKITVDEAIANFIELPINIDYINGTLDTGYKFSLLGCSRNGTESNISTNTTTFSYLCRYMLNGIHSKDTMQKFRKIEFSVNNIIEWGGESGYEIDDKYRLSEKETSSILLHSDETFKIEYLISKSFLPITKYELLKSKIELHQEAIIIITLQEENTIYSFEDIFNKVKRLIELCIRESVTINNIIGYSADINKNYSGVKIETGVKISSYYLRAAEGNVKLKYSYKWISLQELIENNSFSLFFSKYEKLDPIIELYLDSIYSEQLSTVKKFLNVIQSLETYHSRFKANKLKEFKHRISVLVNQRPVTLQEETRKYLLARSKKFPTLESRMADLLIADYETRFDVGDINYRDFPRIIANTRHYYIHYDEDIKKQKVLSTEELSIYNRSLYSILDYYILKELGFSDISKIKKKIKERWGSAQDIIAINEASEKSKGN